MDEHFLVSSQLKKNVYDLISKCQKQAKPPHTVRYFPSPACSAMFVNSPDSKEQSTLSADELEAMGMDSRVQRSCSWARMSKAAFMLRMWIKFSMHQC